MFQVVDEIADVDGSLCVAACQFDVQLVEQAAVTLRQAFLDQWVSFSVCIL